MKTYDNLNQFWQEFTAQNTGKYPFDTWTIVRFSHTSDAEYTHQRQAGKDPLGYQPLLVILANPITHKSRKEVIKNVNDQSLEAFRQHYAQHFMKTLDTRFGLFRPEKFDAYTEYDTWEHFKNSWLERNGRPVIAHNFPLLFDHMPKEEYWLRQKTGQEVLEYQRLIVTTYLVSKDTFFDFMIQNVSDADMEHIKLLMKSRIGLHLDSLFLPEGRAYAGS